MDGLGHAGITPGPENGGNLHLDFPSIHTLEELNRVIAFFDEVTQTFRMILDKQVRQEITRTRNEVEPWLAVEIQRRWESTTPGVQIGDEFPTLVATQLLKLTLGRKRLVRLLDAIFAKVHRRGPRYEYPDGYHSHAQVLGPFFDLDLTEAIALLQDLSALRRELAKPETEQPQDSEGPR